MSPSPIITLCCCAIATAVLHGQPALPLADFSIDELENRLLDIDTRLDQLAHFNFQSGVGSNGDRSKTHKGSAHTEWFEVQLPGVHSIDQIVLVPQIVRDSETGLVVSDGFPVELQIIAGTVEYPEGELITQTSYQNGKQHIAPFIFPTSGLNASWIRIIATELSAQSWDKQYNFQLAEILIFDGNENIALECKVVSSFLKNDYARKERYLVDGFMPYIMNAATGEQSIAFLKKRLEANFTPILTIDLGEVQNVDRIHLHRLELSNSIPFSKNFNYGLPKRLLIEGATQADFSDKRLLLDLSLENVYETGPIIMRNLEQSECRFIRLTVTKPYIDTMTIEPTVTLGFSEIEIFSNQTNVAYQKTFTANFEITNFSRKLSNLTDGNNFYGKILSIREWLEQLTERYDLETERPHIRAELDNRYAQQTIMLQRMGWLAMFLTTGIVFIILVDRILRLRQIAKMRERFAADLHDDIGASLHTIGLLGEVALASIDSPERLNTALTRSRELTTRISATVRHGTDLQSIGRLEAVEKDIRRIAERILIKIDYDISTTGNDSLNKLKPRLKMDLLLFVKECLTNIVKHSNADKVRIEIIAHSKAIEIKVKDNGSGLENDTKQQIPPSLKRRARVMNASIFTGKSIEYSTVIHLIRKKYAFAFWK